MIPEMDSRSEAWGAHSLLPLPLTALKGGHIVDPTGEFPKGRIDPSDIGAVRLAIGHDKGNVIIDFGTRLMWIGFPPGEARELCALILEHAEAIEKERQ